MKFWKRKAEGQEAQEGSKATPMASLQVRSAIEQNLVGTYGDFSALELVACLEPAPEEAPGLLVFTRFRLPPSKGGRGVAAFYFLPQSSQVYMFNTATSGPYVVEAIPPDEEGEIISDEEPVKTILGMRVAATSESDRR